MMATVDIQRQVTAVTGITAEDMPLPLIVQGSIRGIQIQPDPFRRRSLVGLQEMIDQQSVHALRIGHDLLVTARFTRIGQVQLQAAESAGAVAKGLMRSCTRTRSRLNGPDLSASMTSKLSAHSVSCKICHLNSVLIAAVDDPDSSISLGRKKLWDLKS